MAVLFSFVIFLFLVFKSFCLRDRGRLGNEGRPISLKVGTQSRYVDFCNMPKFQLQRPFFSRVVHISPSVVLRGWFPVQFWPLFNLSFSNVQFTADKNKTIFVTPYLLWVKPLAHGNVSLGCGCYHNYLKHMGSNRKWPVFKTLYFPCPCFISWNLDIPEKFCH